MTRPARRRYPPRAIPRRIALIAALSGCVAVFANALPRRDPPRAAPRRRRPVPLHVEPDRRAPGGDRGEVWPRAGVKPVRIDIGWPSLEPRRQSAQPLACPTRRPLREPRARARDGGPGHAALDAGLGQRRRERVEPADARRADFARFARWAARHFRGRVGAWEVWNEPNDRSFWQGSARRYVRLLRAAYPGDQGRRPECARRLRRRSCTTTTASSRAPTRAGAHGSFDVMATHPTRARRRGARDRRRRRRLVADHPRAGDPRPDGAPRRRRQADLVHRVRLVRAHESPRPPVLGAAASRRRSRPRTSHAPPPSSSPATRTSRRPSGTRTPPGPAKTSSSRATACSRPISHRAPPTRR